MVYWFNRNFHTAEKRAEFARRKWCATQGRKDGTHVASSHASRTELNRTLGCGTHITASLFTQLVRPTFPEPLFTQTEKRVELFIAFCLRLQLFLAPKWWETTVAAHRWQRDWDWDWDRRECYIYTCYKYDNFADFTELWKCSRLTAPLVANLTLNSQVSRYT